MGPEIGHGPDAGYVREALLNVVSMCCVLNEERNIERYCQVYERFVDTMVICDGGSTDNTVKLAKQFPKVDVVHFDKLIDFGGIPSNPLEEIHNFAYKATKKHNPDWIVTDECDSLPTFVLQKSIREILEGAVKDIIGVTRVYIVGNDEYFPALSMKGFFGWAHRPDKVNGHYGGNKFAGIPRPDFPHPDTELWRELEPPLSLLHYGWPDKETVAFKTKRYKANGALPPHESASAIPLNAGKSFMLPGWAVWN